MTKENWIVKGHTGRSSTAIWSHFMHGDVFEKGWSNPSDPSDFLRCYWLLKLAPEWRARIFEMAKYRGWEEMALVWDELETMLEQAWPESCESGDYGDRNVKANAMYERMQELRFR